MLNTYLVVITTVLVITQIARLAQNTIQLIRQNKLIKRELEGLEDIDKFDLYNQRKAYRLIIEYLERRLDSKEDAE